MQHYERSDALALRQVDGRDGTGCDGANVALAANGHVAEPIGLLLLRSAAQEGELSLALARRLAQRADEAPVINLGLADARFGAGTQRGQHYRVLARRGQKDDRWKARSCAQLREPFKALLGGEILIEDYCFETCGGEFGRELSVDNGIMLGDRRVWPLDGDVMA